MFVFITASLVLLVNVLTSESVNILPICPKLQVKCLNPCELDFDEAGCQICTCPKDCRMKPCPPNYECKNMCVGVGCSDYQCFPKCSPVGCENKCSSGYWIDANGCPTCRCNNVCEDVQCKPDTTCVPRNATNPLAGYDCVPMQILCCPKPTVPKIFNIPQNYCQKCSLNCFTMKCSKGTLCCPDWFGCFSCMKLVPC